MGAPRGREWDFLLNLRQNTTTRAGIEKGADYQSLTILSRMLAALDSSSSSLISPCLNYLELRWSLGSLLPGDLSLFGDSAAHQTGTR